MTFEERHWQAVLAIAAGTERLSTADGVQQVIDEGYQLALQFENAWKSRNESEVLKGIAASSAQRAKAFSGRERGDQDGPPRNDRPET